uniref:G2/mitotic-specific cyclin-B2 n=1 Tax=Neogobius melanostomus TaxID=47308 RepID=A0A8C6TQ99_9GOBI
MGDPTRGTKPPTTELQDHSGSKPSTMLHVKRSSSPPNGAPKKRTAFIDITNVRLSKHSLCFTRKLHKTHQPKWPNEEKNNRLNSNTDCDIFYLSNLFLFLFSFPQIPSEFDIDSEHAEDCSMTPEYFLRLFRFVRQETFVLSDYMSTQSSLSAEMRAILVDWLVEVQENFELFHETLYLAVKMADHYLSKTVVQKEMLQLVGSTALLIASKFEERSPPCVDDFLFICDDAYKREELIAMEGNILQTLKFDINIPIPYRFLRRYARRGMDTLTLARYYCEMSLLDMNSWWSEGQCWLQPTPCLQFHSGYDLSAPLDDRLKAIRSKYSHKVFFEVAKLPMVDMDTLGKALS